MESSLPFVSILMRARNDEALIGRALKAVFAQKTDLKFEVVVCDDASTDGTREVAARFPVRFFERPAGPYKPGRTLNPLVRAAKGDIVVFNNSDAVPLDERWLDELVKPLLAGSRHVFAFANQLPRADAQALVRKDNERAFGDGKVQATWRFFFSLASSATWRQNLLEVPFDEDIQYSGKSSYSWKDIEKPISKVVKKVDGSFDVVRSDEKSAGQVSGFLGNFGVILRAYAYILMLGKQNVKLVGKYATLGANYIKESLKDCYKLPIPTVCKHEFVFDGLVNDGSKKAADGSMEREGATTLDVAKRLLDFGFHAPTIYFPLLFHQAIMIEPTETESIETLDAFIEVMRKIAAEAAEDPAILKSAPHNAPITRPDETTAARQPVLKFQDEAVS